MSAMLKYPVVHKQTRSHFFRRLPWSHSPSLLSSGVPNISPSLSCFPCHVVHSSPSSWNSRDSVSPMMNFCYYVLESVGALCVYIYIYMYMDEEYNMSNLSVLNALNAEYPQLKCRRNWPATYQLRVCIKSAPTTYPHFCILAEWRVCRLAELRVCSRSWPVSGQSPESQSIGQSTASIKSNQHRSNVYWAMLIHILLCRRGA